MKTTSKIKNITRNEAVGCVMARISRNKVQHAKNFSLANYGSWKKAEEAALQWIAKIKRTLPPALSAKDRMTERNVSGFVGVSLKRSIKQLSNEKTVYYAWHAFWPDNSVGVRWSVDKYGDEGAFVRAVLARQLESNDREEVEAAFAKIKNKAQYRAILRKKSVEVV